MRQVVHPVRQADCIERFQALLYLFRFAQPAVPVINQRQDHVFQGRGARQQIKALKDKADALAAHLSQLVSCSAG